MMTRNELLNINLFTEKNRIRQEKERQLDDMIRTEYIYFLENLVSELQKFIRQNVKDGVETHYNIEKMLDLRFTDHREIDTDAVWAAHRVTMNEFGGSTNKILHIIKRVREEAGVELREAKDALDFYRENRELFKVPVNSDELPF